jgi:hypothetical protein
MRDVHDPMALVRHAVQAGDWKLVEVIARILGGRSAVPPSPGQRAYATLARTLGLAGDYHPG